MDKKEFISRIQAIGNCEDNTSRLELLAQLQEDATPDYDRLTELETSNSQLSTDCETLRQANMKLFLRLGEHKEPDGKPLEEQKEKREFKNLFNEKGEIK
jgi:flagellar biosynthesis/type III secretory pathway chaperone